VTRAGRARVGVGADADGRLCGALLRHLPPAALQGDGASRSHHDPARLGHLAGHHRAGIRRSQDVPPLSGRPADRLADYLQAGLESPGAPPPRAHPPPIQINYFRHGGYIFTGVFVCLFVSSLFC